MKDCESCVHEYLSAMSDTCRECGIAMLNYKEAKPKPITNYDRVRAKSVEEMAEFMTQTGTEYSCPPPHYFGEKGFCRNELVVMSCRMCWLDWLKQEVEDGSD